ncbi:MAG: hypothetical protein IPM54_13455 [Polyangiaceae bacterium]|nr:hypothetical protein [Polyangiaceae bacterium]
MESLNKKAWPFDIPPDAAVVTTKYVTHEGAPVLEVTHEYDEEEGAIWQFHCGNGDYHELVLQLVRLDEILAMDRTLCELAHLPIGFSATRSHLGDNWMIAKIGNV